MRLLRRLHRLRKLASGRGDVLMVRALVLLKARGREVWRWGAPTRDEGVLIAAVARRARAVVLLEGGLRSRMEPFLDRLVVEIAAADAVLDGL